MNNHTEVKSGYFSAQDRSECALMLEWHQADIISPELALFKQHVSDHACQVTAKDETTFLKAYPQAISSGGFLKSCESLFMQGLDKIDWNMVEKTIQNSIKQFYMMDLSVFGPEVIGNLINDIYFFVSIKDRETKHLLGFMMAAITSALPQGDIKLINLIIDPEYQNRGLQELLLSSIIKVMPQIKRIFTIIRPTSDKMRQSLELCGFQEDKNPVQDPQHLIDTQYFVVLECKIDEPSILKKTVSRLSE